MLHGCVPLLNEGQNWFQWPWRRQRRWTTNNEPDVKRRGQQNKMRNDIGPKMARGALHNTVGRKEGTDATRREKERERERERGGDPKSFVRLELCGPDCSQSLSYIVYPIKGTWRQIFGPGCASLHLCFGDSSDILVEMFLQRHFFQMRWGLKRV